MNIAVVTKTSNRKALSMLLLPIIIISLLNLIATVSASSSSPSSSLSSFFGVVSVSNAKTKLINQQRYYDKHDPSLVTVQTIENRNQKLSPPSIMNACPKFHSKSKSRSYKRLVHAMNSISRGGDQVIEVDEFTGSGNVADADIISGPLPVDSVDLDYDHLIDGAYGWCCNLGAPSALVAGAVIASIYENMNNPDSEYNPEVDTRLTGFLKKLVRWLLITAFACEAMSIFITTVTGTMLLSQDVDSMLHQGIVRTAKTPLQFLHHHFEFEFVTGHLSFLQGLLNWFIAIAISHAIPTAGATVATPMNQFLAIILWTTTIFMLSIYNKHIYFYKNYGTMLLRWFQLMSDRFIEVWPPRPLAFVLFPSLLLTIYMGIHVFFLNGSENLSNVNTIESKSNLKK